MEAGGRRLSRRRLLKLAGAAAAASLSRGVMAQSVPWSAGTESARIKAPPLSTDCHHHIYSSRYAVDPRAVLRPGPASVEDYRILQKRIGTSRNVVVQPSTYGIDNSGLIEALGNFGASARGIAVVNPGVSDAELSRLDAAGVRGIRFAAMPQGGITSFDMIPPLAGRVASMGWHIQVNAAADLILASRDLWDGLPCGIVFDHLGHAPEVGHPAFRLITGLMRQGRAWVKLSGAYMESKAGPPTYADRSAVAKAYVGIAPERCVWGSDWPHPTERVDNKPDDARLFDLLGDWAPQETVRHRILVENPAKLYGFASG
jgi:predicted TIM-barrel fold metal-dependent hydrolase